MEFISRKFSVGILSVCMMTKGTTKTSFTEASPVQSHRVPSLEDPMLGLMLCYHHLEILDNFEQGALHFYFTFGSSNYIASPGATHMERERGHLNCTGSFLIWMMST